MSTNVEPRDLGPLRADATTWDRWQAVFKAYGAETAGRFSVSEWRLEPMYEGPGAHKHDHNEEIFYVMEGVASVMFGTDWVKSRKAASASSPEASCTTFATKVVPAWAC